MKKEWLVEGDLHLVLLLLCRFFMFVSPCDELMMSFCFSVISFVACMRSLKTWILFLYDLSLCVEPTLLSFNPVSCYMVTCVVYCQAEGHYLTLLGMVVYPLKYIENGKKVGFFWVFVFIYSFHFICSLV